MLFRSIRWSEVAIQKGDCEVAIKYYEKANECLSSLIFKDKISLDTKINECRYVTNLNEGEKLLADLSLDKSDVEKVKETFQKAQEYKNTDLTESRIQFCEKLLSALDAESEENWVSSLDYYNEAINYGINNSVSNQIIVKIKEEKAKIAIPKAKVLEVTREPNIYNDGEKGMTIHVHFEAAFMKGLQGRVTAWFYYEGGEKLLDENDHYHTTDGQVSCGKDFEPSYQESVYKDFKLFMPYSELHLSSGSTDLKFKIGVIYNHEQLATSDYLSFRMTK